MEHRIGTWLTDSEHATLRVVMEVLVPNDGISPGAGEAGAADYLDLLLSAFSFDPPRLFAGGPFSGRQGGEAGFDQWLELGALDELGWRIRIEGSNGMAEREFNGPVVGWQQQYRSGLAALGADFCECPIDEQRRRLDTDPDFARLAFEHACESLYGDPVYGGNRSGAGWAAIGFDGDTQPRGWTDAEVSSPATIPVAAPAARGSTR